MITMRGAVVCWLALASASACGTLEAGGASITTRGNLDFFLAKFDPARNTLWARSAGGAGDDDALALAVRPTGEPRITGDFSKQPEFDRIQLENRGKNDVYVAQYTTPGEVGWVRTNGGPENNVCYAIALAPDDGVVIAPSFVGPTTFGTWALTSRAGMDVVVGKMKPISSP